MESHAILAAKKSSGVASEVNLRNPVKHPRDGIHHGWKTSLEVRHRVPIKRNDVVADPGFDRGDANPKGVDRTYNLA